ncbi:FAD:protein FMN transferase [Roseobacter sinensis]|uniref:FAD:protein FMN transferase n=1 Tax=Roseobacter sinensis TaxID=2931391 RepID=A0ABT3BAW5_9RHOB|nr:FAD:protein FMN transferase [Roseobacter sp. WL0113]MCV3270708.1 FAD:protein FMN transferase [Roseobacter sp. WL0113]
MISRRRFLTISCAALAAPARAAGVTTRWHGRALGADVSVAIRGPAEIAEPALEEALRLIARVEALFSLYDPTSLLVRLNRMGHLAAPPVYMLRLFEVSKAMHVATDGLFDPTVQALWQSHAQGRPLAEAYPTVGWQRVQFDRTEISLAAGQQLTFNGIAQGYATDLVSDALRAAGLSDIHVNIGEHAAFGPARRLGLADPVHGHLGHLTLQNSAIATSSPAATRVGDATHILGPQGAEPRWSTVSVIATRAAEADALSTALCLAPLSLMERLRTLPGVRRIVAVASNGDLITL